MKKIIFSMLLALIASTAAQAQTGGYVISKITYKGKPRLYKDPIQTINYIGNEQTSKVWEIITSEGTKITNYYFSHKEAELAFNQLYENGASISVTSCLRIWSNELQNYSILCDQFAPTKVASDTEELLEKPRTSLEERLKAHRDLEIRPSKYR